MKNAGLSQCGSPANNIVNDRLWLIFRDFPHDGAVAGPDLQEIDSFGEVGDVHRAGAA